MFLLNIVYNHFHNFLLNYSFVVLNFEYNSQSSLIFQLFLIFDIVLSKIQIIYELLIDLIQKKKAIILHRQLKLLDSLIRLNFY